MLWFCDCLIPPAYALAHTNRDHIGMYFAGIYGVWLPPPESALVSNLGC